MNMVVKNADNNRAAENCIANRAKERLTCEVQQKLTRK